MAGYSSYNPNSLNRSMYARSPQEQQRQKQPYQPQSNAQSSQPAKPWHPADFYFWRQQQGHAMTPRLGPPGWGTMPAMPPSGGSPQLYANRPAQGSPPAPTGPYAQRPDAGQPPSPPVFYGNAQYPDVGGYPPSPMQHPEGYPYPAPTQDRDYRKSSAPLYQGSGPVAGAVGSGIRAGRGAMDYAKARGGAQAQYQARVDEQRQRIAGINEQAGSLSTPEELAQRGAQLQGPYQPQTPWAGNPAYGNVQLPPTEFGPNQSTPQVRDRIADRYDPTSWAVMSRTPGEINQQVGERTQQHLDGLRQRGYDPTGAKQGYQISPVNGAGAAALAQQDEARRAQERQQFDATRARQQVKLAERAKANGVSVDQQKIADGKQATETAKFQNYVRNSSAIGERPMSYQEWVQAGGSKGEVTKALEQSAFKNRYLAKTEREAERAANRDRPSYQRSIMMARYGVPMQMPEDPTQAQNWMQSMAMGGNPYANHAYGQAINEQGQNIRNAGDNMARMSGYQSQVEQARIVAGAKSQAGLDPYQRMQMYELRGRMTPTIAGQKVYDEHMRGAKESGRFAQSGEAVKVEAEARERAAQAAREQQALIDGMSKDPVLGQFFGPSNQPQSTTPAPQGDVPGLKTEKLAENVPETKPLNPAGAQDAIGLYRDMTSQLGKEPTREEFEAEMKRRGMRMPDKNDSGAGSVDRWVDPAYTSDSFFGGNTTEHQKFAEWLKKNKIVVDRQQEYYDYLNKNR